MKRLLSIGLLAVCVLAVSERPAQAWVNAKFSIGLNWHLQSANNNFFWGLYKNGQVPGPEAFGAGGYPGPIPFGTNPPAGSFPFYGNGPQMQPQPMPAQAAPAQAPQQHAYYGYNYNPYQAVSYQHYSYTPSYYYPMYESYYGQTPYYWNQGR